MEASNVAARTVEDAGWLRVMEVATLSCLPMAAKAAVELHVMDILAKHAGEGEGGYLSASQIASHFESPLASTTTLEQASFSLDRILRVLACHGLLSSSLLSSPSPGGLSIRTYALNSFSKYLLPNEALAPMILYLLDPLVLQPFFHLHEAVLDGATPFSKAHKGMPSCWHLFRSNPLLNQLFNQAMVNYSQPLMRSLLEKYHGFDDITTLVDVGGGHAGSLRMIISKYPHIKGINFDQVHVVADAPPYPGIQYVGGDVFVDQIPQASAIFMKGFLPDWSDADCIKILKNCYRALPNKGKVINVGGLLPAHVDCELKYRVRYHMDLLMFALNEEGKERTYRDLEVISKASGFSRLQVVCDVNGNCVVEIHK